MRVLVFRHVTFEHLGLIAPALEANNIAWDYVEPGAAVSPDDAGGFISMGGPMSANDDLPYIHRELRFLEQAVAAGKPILGVCLGAQMIAKALGSKVYRNRAKEIGWEQIHWTEAAGQDPVFSGLTEPETVLHWHGETFDLPQRAVWLAWSDACRNQAFRIGPSVYGLQFHLEVTPAMISGWCREGENAGDLRELKEPIDPHRNAGRLKELSALVFGRWAKLLANS
jgi:GMP synthase-like glutamine amidotransferase